MAAFRPGVDVQQLETLKGLTKHAMWRTVERFVLFGASEHGQCNLLVYNQHQPTSDLRKFPQNQKLEFSNAIIRSAVQYCADEPECAGFVFDGDANLGMAPWLTILTRTAHGTLTLAKRVASAPIMVLTVKLRASGPRQQFQQHCDIDPAQEA